MTVEEIIQLALSRPKIKKALKGKKIKVIYFFERQRVINIVPE